MRRIAAQTRKTETEEWLFAKLDELNIEDFEKFLCGDSTHKENFCAAILRTNLILCGDSTQNPYIILIFCEAILGVINV